MEEGQDVLALLLGPNPGAIRLNVSSGNGDNRSKGAPWLSTVQPMSREAGYSLQPSEG